MDAVTRLQGELIDARESYRLANQRIIELLAEKIALAAALDEARKALDFLRHPLADKLADPSTILAAREKPLRDGLLFVRRWFEALESGLPEDDPLREIRQEVHAPVYRAIDEALASSPDVKL
jgi:hypothetical protein